jgi:hypothetical protein
MTDTTPLSHAEARAAVLAAIDSVTEVLEDVCTVAHYTRWPYAEPLLVALERVAGRYRAAHGHTEIWAVLHELPPLWPLTATIKW